MAARDDLPPLDLLTSFDAAARLASFTRAATELHLTQSAVSRQIQALEESLGVALFTRHHRRIVLTEAGESYSRTVTSALASLRLATRAIAANTRARTLTVTTSLSFASLWLVPRLGRFQARYPAVDVRVAASNRIEDLDRGGIDVAIRYCPASLAGPDAWRLFGERVSPVASPKLIKRALTDANAVRRFPLLHLEDTTVQWPWLQWPVWLEVHGASGPMSSAGVRFSHYDQMIQAAIEGQGVALGRRPLVDAALAAGRLIAPFGKRFTAQAGEARAYYALTGQTARSRTDVQGFLAWLREEIGVLADRGK
jgi:LysR family transcriptional regulator, glycine cleavage system transcriptional activator